VEELAAVVEAADFLVELAVASWELVSEYLEDHFLGEVLVGQHEAELAVSGE
jgi:hypothetical protein